MNGVLISLNKPHTDNIFTFKKKKVEWRKRPLPKRTHYAYETKNKGGCGKVIGRFDVVETVEFDPLNHHWYSLEFIEDGCVPIEELIEYANGEVIYGNVLEAVEKYDKPKGLYEFKHACPCYVRSCQGCRYSDDGWNCTPITRPPQSWMYVEGPDE